MTNRLSHSKRLRHLLLSDETLFAPVGALPVHAQMAEAAGFEAFQLSNGFLARFYGLPTPGLLTQTEVVEIIRAITPIVGIPVYADAATGFGAPINVRRTTEEFLRAGAAGLQLGDQAGAGYARPGEHVELLASEEMVGRLRAAVDARDELDSDAVVAARTDVRGATNVEEAIGRANTYLVKGHVDLVHVEGAPNWETAERILAAIDGPAAVSVRQEPARTPSRARLCAIGQRIQPLWFALPGIQAVWELLLRTRDAGESAPVDIYREHLFSLRGTERFVGYGDRFARPSYAEARTWEDAYLPEWMRPAYDSAEFYTG